MSNHMKTLLALVSLVVCAAPVARAYEGFVPIAGPVGPMEIPGPPRLPIPQGYDYSTPPSQLINQPTQTNCVQTTYGFRCFSL